MDKGHSKKKMVSSTKLVLVGLWMLSKVPNEGCCWSDDQRNLNIRMWLGPKSDSNLLFFFCLIWAYVISIKHCTRQAHMISCFHALEWTEFQRVVVPVLCGRVLRHPQLLDWKCSYQHSCNSIPALNRFFFFFFTTWWLYCSQVNAYVTFSGACYNFPFLLFDLHKFICVLVWCSSSESGCGVFVSGLIISILFCLFSLVKTDIVQYPSFSVIYYLYRGALCGCVDILLAVAIQCSVKFFMCVWWSSWNRPWALGSSPLFSTGFYSAALCGSSGHLQDIPYTTVACIRRVGKSIYHQDSCKGVSNIKHSAIHYSFQLAFECSCPLCGFLSSV